MAELKPLGYALALLVLLSAPSLLAETHDSGAALNFAPGDHHANYQKSANTGCAPAGSGRHSPVGDRAAKTD